MRRLFAFVVFIGAGAYLVREYQRPPQAPPGPPQPPAIEQPDPAPVFSESEVAKIRQSLQDGDPGVRWAAVQLLYNIRDPKLGPLLEILISQDPDPDVRVKVIGLMKGREDLGRLGGLVRGLSDADKGVRIASLAALADIGDPSVATWVTALLRDPEPEVRIAALQTLGKFQEKRKKEFRALADKLRKDYEEALRRSAERQR